MQQFAMTFSSDITHAYVYATEMVKHRKIEKIMLCFVMLEKWQIYCLLYDSNVVM